MKQSKAKVNMPFVKMRWPQIPEPEPEFHTLGFRDLYMRCWLDLEMEIKLNLASIKISHLQIPVNCSTDTLECREYCVASHYQYAVTHRCRKVGFHSTSRLPDTLFLRSPPSETGVCSRMTPVICRWTVGPPYNPQQGCLDHHTARLQNTRIKMALKNQLFRFLMFCWTSTSGFK